MARRSKGGVRRGATLALTVDGLAVTAYEGETIATVLLLLDKTACYRTRSDRPRMMFCNMGACFECRVRVTRGDQVRWMLACTTEVAPGMQVDTGLNLALSLPGGRNPV